MFLHPARPTDVIIFHVDDLLPWPPLMTSHAFQFSLQNFSVLHFSPHVSWPLGEPKRANKKARSV
jgi:hypothetical protein